MNAYAGSQRLIFLIRIKLALLFHLPFNVHIQGQAAKRGFSVWVRKGGRSETSLYGDVGMLLQKTVIFRASGLPFPIFFQGEVS